jgi:hypothetical protein
LGVPPQEKCGVGLFVSIFFVFCIWLTPKAKKQKRISTAIPHASKRPEKADNDII